MAKPQLATVPERWRHDLTLPQCEAIEYMAKSEAEDFRAWFRAEGKCWYCCRAIDPDDPVEGHEADCLYLAICELAQAFDTE